MFNTGRFYKFCNIAYIKNESCIISVPFDFIWVNVGVMYVTYFSSVSLFIFQLTKKSLEVCVKYNNAVRWSEGRSQKVRGIDDVIQKEKLLRC